MPRTACWLQVPLLLAAAAPLAAQASQVPMPAAPQQQVEVVGLRRWTVKDLEDSLGRYAPETPLRTGGCEDALRTKLRFPEASVMVYYSASAESGQSLPVTLVAVVEPQDAGRVQWRAAPKARMALPKSWRSTLVPLVWDTAGGLRADRMQVFVQSYSQRRGFGLDSARRIIARRDSANIASYVDAWAALAARTAPADMEAAHRHLTRSSDPAHRAMAVAVLMNFPGHDLAWHDMVRALRDPDRAVRFTAFLALWGMIRFDARPVDWTPVTADLRALLGGTHLTAFSRVTDLLVATQFPTALAPTVLAGNSDLLLDYAEVKFPLARRPARALLGRLSGQPEAGRDTWRAWADSLPLPAARSGRR